MLYWASRHNICCFLDNHQYRLTGAYECIAGVGIHRSVTAGAGNALEQLDGFLRQQEDWHFGHIGYDIKNEIEALSSFHPDPIGFPDLFFFVPGVVLILTEDKLTIGAFGDHEEVMAAIDRTTAVPDKPYNAGIRHRLSKEEYLQKVHRLKEHIQRGDCYEVNFCQEFYGEGADISEVMLYQSLCRESPNPYACFYRIDHRYLLCASPERYIHRAGNTILSQPIKGTIARNRENPAADQAAKTLLQHNAKEQSENVMVVDLVRNDLSKICREGSVRVDELFGIYSFPQVHQMVSTVKGELKENVTMADIFRASFPMASMTGVPKKRVMELIEKYETVKRGLYSGSVGYIAPDGDFDFNVVIRSIQYNAGTKYLSFHTGSAITFNSNPEAEYEECLVKASHIKKVLNG